MLAVFSISQLARSAIEKETPLRMGKLKPLTYGCSCHLLASHVMVIEKLKQILYERTENVRPHNFDFGTIPESETEVLILNQYHRCQMSSLKRLKELNTI